MIELNVEFKIPERVNQKVILKMSKLHYLTREFKHGKFMIRAETSRRTKVELCQVTRLQIGLEQRW